MEHFALPTTNWLEGGVPRYEKFHFWIGSRHVSVPRFLPGRPFKAFHGGSSYWSLTRAHAEYVCDYLRSRPGAESFFRHTFIPDEMFFQSVLLNGGLGSQIDNTNALHVDWSDPRESPKVLRSRDWDALKASGKLFARKFDIAEDSGILDRIDRELLGL
jgi:hypothetical protein